MSLRRVLAACIFALPLAAFAQSYPSKPIRLVVPFPPAGATDILSRELARQLSDRLKQQVIVDNRPGAGGTLGSDIVAKSAPDGYTIQMATSSTHSIGPESESEDSVQRANRLHTGRARGQLGQRAAHCTERQGEQRQRADRIAESRARRNSTTARAATARSFI